MSEDNTGGEGSERHAHQHAHPSHRHSRRIPSLCIDRSTDPNMFRLAKRTAFGSRAGSEPATSTHDNKANSPVHCSNTDEGEHCSRGRPHTGHSALYDQCGEVLRTFFSCASPARARRETRTRRRKGPKNKGTIDKAKNMSTLSDTPERSKCIPLPMMPYARTCVCDLYLVVCDCAQEDGLRRVCLLHGQLHVKREVVRQRAAARQVRHVRLARGHAATKRSRHQRRVVVRVKLRPQIHRGGSGTDGQAARCR